MHCNQGIIVYLVYTIIIRCARSRNAFVCVYIYTYESHAVNYIVALIDALKVRWCGRFGKTFLCSENVLIDKYAG